ncbi:hypothetical protein GCM10010532_002510 [Dactylosporangium siamense]|uniref:Uncharacterized protein n=1 Tax=Dactylosporangium siamense TaxID=685454 RepID=A0A919UA11_9ACTN|nr:hypothetical protein Dsi01nite_023160 [Dactylosporangium siamense]
MIEVADRLSAQPARDFDHRSDRRGRRILRVVGIRQPRRMPAARSGTADAQISLFARGSRAGKCISPVIEVPETDSCVGGRFRRSIMGWIRADRRRGLFTRGLGSRRGWRRPSETGRVGRRVIAGSAV